MATVERLVDRWLDSEARRFLADLGVRATPATVARAKAWQAVMWGIAFAVLPYVVAFVVLLVREVV